MPTTAIIVLGNFVGKTMKKCKCGMPIYDAPDEPYGWKSDKCYLCWVKSLNEVDRRLFTSSVIYDKPNVIGNAEK